MISDRDKKHILEIMLLFSLIVLGDIVSGAIGIASPASGLRAIQTGTFSVTFTTGQSLIAQIVTFSPSFPSVPIVTAQIGTTSIGIAPGEPLALANTFCLLCASNVSKTFSLSGSNISLFGTADVITLQLPGGSYSPQTSEFGINIDATNCGSSSSLLPQISFNAGSTWQDLASASGALSITLDGTGVFTKAAVNSVTVIPQSTLMYFRALALGPACAVSLFSVTVTMFTQMVQFYSAYVDTRSSQTTVSQTRIVIRIGIPSPVPTNIIFTVIWRATVP